MSSVHIVFFLKPLPQGEQSMKKDEKGNDHLTSLADRVNDWLRTIMRLYSQDAPIPRDTGNLSHRS
jgi:hypothetical protein